MNYELPDFGDQANCRGIDTEMFFTEVAAGYKYQQQLESICGNCTVQADCLDYALHVKVMGWWGGTTDRERVQIRKEFGIEPEPVGKLYLIGGQDTVQL